MQIQRTRRNAEGRLAAGVASGIARSLNVRVLYVRIAFVILAGVSIPLYILLWGLLRADDGTEGFLGRFKTEEESDVRRGIAFGAIVLGGFLLLRRLGIWLPGKLLWPLVLVSIGLAIVWKRPTARNNKSLELALLKC